MKLSRATLRAILKYPWLRSDRGLPNRKWGVYLEDESAFRFAYADYYRDCEDGTPHHRPPRRSIEAEIMDWSDDAAYAIDDMIDFYEVGRIPLDRLAVKRTGESDRFLDSFFQRKGISESIQPDYRAAWKQIRTMLVNCGVNQPYAGSMRQREAVSDLIFHLHNYLRGSTTLSSDTRPDGNGDRLMWKKDKKGANLEESEEYAEIVVDLLKGLTWEYVILSSSLAGQQEGYSRVIRELFNVFADAANSAPSSRRILPVRFKEMLAHLEQRHGFLITGDQRARAAADMVADLTDQEALNYYQRLTGNRPGSVFLPPIM
jgi:dGTPase